MSANDLQSAVLAQLGDLLLADFYAGVNAYIEHLFESVLRRDALVIFWRYYTADPDLTISVVAQLAAVFSGEDGWIDQYGAICGRVAELI